MWTFWKLYLFCEACDEQYDPAHKHRLRLIFCPACAFVADLSYAKQDHYLNWIEQSLEV
jgi:hypothetical protein